MVDVEEVIVVVSKFQGTFGHGCEGLGWDYTTIRHIGAFKEEFTSYAPLEEGSKCAYGEDNRSVPVKGKGKVFLKLTFGKTFSLSDVLHISHFRHNLISVHLLGKARIKVLFDNGIITIKKKCLCW